LQRGSLDEGRERLPAKFSLKARTAASGRAVWFHTPLATARKSAPAMPELGGAPRLDQHAGLD
jgi:hypothetical protein